MKRTEEDIKEEIERQRIENRNRKREKNIAFKKQWLAESKETYKELHKVYRQISNMKKKMIKLLAEEV